MGTDSVDAALGSLHVDDRSIRLDCPGAWLRMHRHRLSVCGVHLATPEEVAHGGFAEHAIVPDAPVPLTTRRSRCITPFLAAPGTPAGLCVGFGRLSRSHHRMVAAASEEATRPDFVPHYGSRYALGSHSGRLVDVLTARGGTRTTTVMDPRIAQYSEPTAARWVGMHYDNAWTSQGEGERYLRDVRVACADRRVIHNLGPGARSLVFALNMSALHLSDKVRPGDSRNVPSTKQLRDFLAEHPAEVLNIVCLVWTTEVGDLVVLPAGLALHDGSMEGHPYSSSALVFAGNFPRGAFSQA
ncbi:hypothetical protein JCM4814A_80750 [Streptomyces phaeofaciens JCM 4814]|uniref:Uncharacterized protein n=1 Tax=Streptomyces phaeofaciens TaxID=68254 RepID=A0A918HS14_9ACTN|nr:hypothetical protein [Streptomyces phaeofaciens]GGT95425.1 hypothetical protein GCM10010226_86370 [Streptomyces phaeofaciens]